MRIIQSSNIFITPRVMRMACLPTKPLNSVKEKGFYGTARYVVEVEVMDFVQYKPTFGPTYN